MIEVSSADDRLAALASLNEPTRRRIYRFVVGQTGAQSRDAVASSLGLARSVAAFHLEKLAEVGLLEYELRRPWGRTGPGAGRPAKFYRRAAAEIGLTVPERHYDLAAHLLARSIEDANARDVPVGDALRSVAREHGRALGSRVQPAKGLTRRRQLEWLAGLLAAQGYEPHITGWGITLRNCPFHSLTEEHRELVCQMNLELIDALLEGGGLSGASAMLEPAPGRCCVSVRW
jgi:predicted ArsR family transcriptional regulator